MGCNIPSQSSCFSNIKSRDLFVPIDVLISGIDFLNTCIASLRRSRVVIESCRAKSTRSFSAVKPAIAPNESLSVALINSNFTGIAGIHSSGRARNLLLLVLNCVFLKGPFAVLLVIREDVNLNITIRKTTFLMLSSYVVRFHQLSFPHSSKINIIITESIFINITNPRLREQQHIFNKGDSFASISIRGSDMHQYSSAMPLRDGNGLTRNFKMNKNKMTMSVSNCTFSGGRSGLSFLDMHYNVTVNIIASVFHSMEADVINYYNREPSSVLTDVKFTIEDSTFTENGMPNRDHEGIHFSESYGGVTIRGTESCGTYGLSLLPKVSVKNTVFYDNRAQISGGALYFYLVKATITNCSFIENEAGFRETSSGQYTFGTGGALYLGQGCSAVIRDCVFKDNFARYGSAIYEVSGHNSYLLELDNITVLSSFMDDSFFMIPSLNIVSLGAVQAFHSFNLSVRNVRLECPVQYNITVNTFVDNYLSANCNSCPDNTYSLDAAVANVHACESTKHRCIDITPISCHDCPFGGTCENGVLIPKPNFWKYSYQSKAYFVSCPVFYCKQEEHLKSSCISTRTGTLCGACREEFTENVYTSSCMKTKECRPQWFWLSLVSVALLYLLLIMFLQEVSACLGWLLHIRIPFIKNREPSLTVPLLYPDEHHVPRELEISEKSGTSENLLVVKDHGLSNDSSDSLVGGMIKIFSFYYQIDVLFNFFENRATAKVFLSIKNALISILNLSPEGSSLHLLGCPFARMNAVTKVVMKASLPIFILALAGVVYGMSVIILKVKNYISKKRLNNVQIDSIRTRLLCTILQIILLSYSTITSNVFSLVTCITLEDGRKILFIDGNSPCYQWWQWICLAFISIWVVPLGISLIVAPALLRKQRITVMQLFISLVVPLPMNIYFLIRHFVCSHCCAVKLQESWISKQCANQTEKDVVDRHAATLEDLGESKYEELNGNDLVSATGKDRTDKDGTTRVHTREHNRTVEEQLLFILEGSFMKPTSKKSYQYWDAILIFQRLALLFVYAFATEPVGKAYLMLILMILIFSLHLRMLPFQNRLLNTIQALLLFFACVNSAINVFDAYTYVRGKHLSGPLIPMSNLFDIIVTTMHLFFPTIILLSIISFVIIRLIYSIFQCTKAISYWLKPSINVSL